MFFFVSGSSPPVSLALKASSTSGSPKRAATLPDALLRGIKLHQPPDPPVYIPNLQEETILAVFYILYPTITYLLRGQLPDIRKLELIPFHGSLALGLRMSSWRESSEGLLKDIG